MSKSGPDPDFPILNEYERFSFPSPLNAKHESIIAFGGNLSPGMLLSAYEQGLFPWYGEDDPIIWQSPDPRFIIYPSKLHVSSSMKKVLKRKIFTITFDLDFSGVISACSKIIRSSGGSSGDAASGTWITGDIISAYTELHHLGWVHSAEAWFQGELSGGCYGMRLGNVFFGESMFAKKPNASKAAFLTLAKHLFQDGVSFIDCQQPSRHMESLGGELISRREFIILLQKTLASRPQAAADEADRRGSWFKCLLEKPKSP